MANIYVRSTDGSNADNGSTWALAKATLAGADAIDAAGDNIYISQSHAESTAGALTFSWAGTKGSTTKVICVNDGAEPPTAVATTATVTATGNNNVQLAATSGNHVYVYGISFFFGSGVALAPTMRLVSGGSPWAVYDSCNFSAQSTAASNIILTGSGTGGMVEVINCGFKFNDASQFVNFGVNGRVWVKGGSVLAGGTSPTTFLISGSTNAFALFEGFDFSNCSSSMNLTDISAGFNTRVVFKNCKLPSSWSGALNASSPPNGTRVELSNTDSTNTNYRLWINEPFGDITSETTLVRTGGANDGVTGLSWKMVTNSSVSWVQPLVSGEFVKRNTITGSSVTATVEVLHDSATNLKDSEIRLLVDYLSASGTPLGTFTHDGSADILAAGVDQATSSATWTTTGMSNPNKQKLSVTFTPQKIGYVHAWVEVRKSSYTVYVDPLITIS